MNETLAAIAATQSGVFTRAQARVAGYTHRAIACHLRAGRWQVRHHGVYTAATTAASASPGTAADVALRAAAASLALRGTVVSHATAARSWGIDVLGPSSDDVVLTCARRAPTTVRRYEGVTVLAAGLPSAHVVHRGAVPLTTAARTVVDLARGPSFRRGVVAADSALHRGLVTEAELAKVAGDCAGWPGIRRARRVLEFADGRAESVLESVGRVLMHEQGLPAPELQVVLGDEDGPIGRVDFYWAAYRTVGEADGLLKYTEPEALVAEKLREERLREAGFEVVRFTSRQAFGEPERTAHRFRQGFARGVLLAHRPA